MRASTLKTAAWHYPKSFLAALGLVWLFIEPIIGLAGKNFDLTYGQFFIASVVLSFVWLLIDGYIISGS